MAVVNQQDPSGTNQGWPPEVITRAPQENVTFNAYRSNEVDLGSVPSNWRITANNANVAVAVAGAEGTWEIAAAVTGKDTPGTTLTIRSG